MIEAAPIPALVTDANWERRAQKLAGERLTALRGQGEKWAASVGALTGILGIVTLAKGPDDVSKLPSPWQGWAIALIGLAVLAGVVALLAASFAAQGWPRDSRFTGEEIRRLETSDARTARDLIGWSRIATVLAVAALIGSVGVTWWKTPADTTASGRVLVVRSSGPAVCGELQPTAATESGVRLLEDSTVTPVAVSEIMALSPVKTCPAKK